MNPIELVVADRTAARDSKDPNADICFLALAGPDAKASIRTLVLRDIVANKFVLFMNETSPKWRQLSANAHYEILLWYPSQQKQYRISGSSEKLPQSIVDANWQYRPDGSKFLDYVYQEMAPQSSIIDSRQILVDEIDRIKSRYPVPNMKPPRYVAGIQLIAERIEVLDLNREDRIHDRRMFRLTDSGWQSRVMVP